MTSTQDGPETDWEPAIFYYKGVSHQTRRNKRTGEYIIPGQVVQELGTKLLREMEKHKNG